MVSRMIPHPQWAYVPRLARWANRRAETQAGALVHDLAPVLVIDDHSDILEALATMLKREGFAVVTARNGFAALTLLHDGLRPCIIIMDLTMPVTNRVEFREEQMRDPELAHIPVIACSGLTDPAQSAAHLGATGRVRKPAEVKTLVELVRRHCLKPRAAPRSH
jgi:CheY-like chemotaxis protein